MVTEPEQRYILLPREGLRVPFDNPAIEVLADLPLVRSTQSPRRSWLPLERLSGVMRLSRTILDSIPELPVLSIDVPSLDDRPINGGPRLVQLDPMAAAVLNAPGSPVRAVPIVEYQAPSPLPQSASTAAAAAGLAGGFSFSVICRSAKTGLGLEGARVVAFTNYTTRAGAEGETDSAGSVSLTLPAASIDRLYVYPPAGYWGAYRDNPPLPTLQIDLEEIDFSVDDCVRYYYGSPATPYGVSAEVRIALIDTGASDHNDLKYSHRTNTVTGEPLSAVEDVMSHGTRVAGLIGAQGGPIKGVAPDALLYSYRVYAASDHKTTNYAILKAMIFAAQTGCDIVNLSLAGAGYDTIVAEAIKDAREQGMVVVAAAGNDGRQQVSHPAAYPGALAVTALGRRTTYPAGSVEEGEFLQLPNGSTPDEFIAEFSNIGGGSAGVFATAPGVGAITTLPTNSEYGIASGTSMAAPVISGVIAHLLSNDAAVYSMSRDRARADAIESLLRGVCASCGFGAAYEGNGLPLQSKM